VSSTYQGLRVQTSKGRAGLERIIEMTYIWVVKVLVLVMGKEKGQEKEKE